ncbi:MAG TPA: dethiobiotin synthase [Bacteroidales bacterium]|nr:dethiobiotin synthase [Bacteroidales bacterium]HPS18417.1 dethiobiotin synthase [Bacteroidales bacterium]
MKKYFVTGIGTGVGKTVVSAILVEALKADYWKPIQCGELENSDSDIVRNLISNSQTKIHPETYRLKTPASPHYAAEVEKIKIDIEKIIIPETKNDLIIEGAGGLMVPLNDDFLMIDLIKQLNAEVILVSQNYLGSINHTLLSLEALKSRNIPVKGIVFNSEPNHSSEKYILENSKIPCVLNLFQQKKVDKALVVKYATKIINLV